jgi:hypothetical protein
MNKNKLLLGMLTLCLTLSVLIAGCTGSDPKVLAKQSYELGKQAMASLLEPQKYAGLMKKAAEIKTKVSKLSASDKAIYRAELLRLAGDDADEILKAAGDITESAVETAGKALDAAGQAAGKALDAASKLADDPAVKEAQQKLQDAAKKAAGEIFKKSE